MKYVVLPVHDSEDPTAVADVGADALPRADIYAVVELRSYEPPVFWGPFYSALSAHKHAQAGTHQVPFEVER